MGAGGGGYADFSRFTPARLVRNLSRGDYRLIAGGRVPAGAAMVSLLVQADGLPSNCRIVRSSGDPYVDSRTRVRSSSSGCASGRRSTIRDDLSPISSSTSRPGGSSALAAGATVPFALLGADASLGRVAPIDVVEIGDRRPPSRHRGQIGDIDRHRAAPAAPAARCPPTCQSRSWPNSQRPSRAASSSRTHPPLK